MIHELTEREKIEKESNYYDILGCTEDATSKQLKQSYQHLIRKYHPDKQEVCDSSSSNFILIDKAYKTLKDDKLRKEYDAALLENSFNDNCLIYAELSKTDLQGVDNEIKYPCRCGKDILIPEEFLVEAECIIECSECTNCILIK